MFMALIREFRIMHLDVLRHSAGRPRHFAGLSADGLFYTPYNNLSLALLLSIFSHAFSKCQQLGWEGVISKIVRRCTHYQRILKMPARIDRDSHLAFLAEFSQPLKPFLADKGCCLGILPRRSAEPT